jgi:hypothetical protein
MKNVCFELIVCADIHCQKKACLSQTYKEDILYSQRYAKGEFGVSDLTSIATFEGLTVMSGM